MFEITFDPLDPLPLVESVHRDRSGALVLFIGLVRDQDEGRAVRYLEYEAYGAMAVKEMTRIGEEVRSRWDSTEIAIRHRVGRLKVGEASVIIAVSAPHREDAFAACHYAIDRLKEIVPIWKREVWDGGESWQGGHPVRAPGDS
jgi:molybdopterin synthase catalytic subunit